MINRFLQRASDMRLNIRSVSGGFLFVLGMLFLGQMPLSLLIGSLASGHNVTAQDVNDNPEEFGLSTEIYLSLAMFSFILAMGALWFVIRFFHNGRFRQIVSPNPRLRLGRLLLPGLIWFVFSAGYDVYSWYMHPELYTLTFNWQSFLPLLLIGLFLLPFQTSFEEFFLRGYLMPAVAYGTRNAIPGLLVSATVFALMHSFNPEVDKYGFLTMFPYYFGFGFFLGFIAIWDQGLEIPLSLHYFNNLYSLLIVTFEGSALRTSAVFTLKEMDMQASMIYFYISMLLITFLCMLFCRWKWPPALKVRENNDEVQE